MNHAFELRKTTDITVKEICAITDQLTTVIDKQDSKNGLTMTVKEAAYDGSRLIVTVVYTGEKELSMKEEIVGFNYITINGQPVKPAIGSTG